MPSPIFEPLCANHDRAAFSCGEPALDRYIQEQAAQDVKKNLAAVFVLTLDGKHIDGYYTLSSYSVSLDTVPEEIAKKLTRQREVPATLIGRLARSSHLKGKGVGDNLLVDALFRALEQSKIVASWAVVVDAKNDKAVEFYKRHGFLEIPSIHNRLFLPMATIAKLAATR